MSRAGRLPMAGFPFPGFLSKQESTMRLFTMAAIFRHPSSLFHTWRHGRPRGLKAGAQECPLARPEVRAPGCRDGDRRRGLALPVVRGPLVVLDARRAMGLLPGEPLERLRSARTACSPGRTRRRTRRRSAPRRSRRSPSGRSRANVRRVVNTNPRQPSRPVPGRSRAGPIESPAGASAFTER